MKIKKEIIDRINNVQTRMKLASILGIGEQMLYDHINRNKPGGRLTRIDALLAIAEELGIPQSEVSSLVEEDQSVKV